MSRPFILIGSVFFVSMCVFNYTDINAVAVVFAAAAVLSVVSAALRKMPYMRIALLACVCLTVSSGLYLADYYTKYEPLYALCDGGGHSVTGVITETDHKYGSCYVTLSDLEIDGAEYRAELTVFADDFPDITNRGKLMLTGAVIRLRGTTNGSKMNNRARGQAFIISQYDTIRSAGESGPSLTEFFAGLRKRIGAAFDEYLPSDISGLAAAILTGDASALPDSVSLDFRYAGLAHLFAVSGLHLTVWTGLIFFLLRRSKFRRLRPIVSTLFILFYMAFTGFSYSVVRSGVMLLVMNAAAFVKPEYDPLSALFFAVTAILFINPFAAVSISLQMSFLTVLGLLVFMPELMKKADRYLVGSRSGAVRHTCRWLLSAVAVSLIASVSALPVTIQSFSYWSPIGLVANPASLVPAEIFMVLSGAGAALSGVPGAARTVFAVVRVLGRYLLFVTHGLSRLRYAVIPAEPRFFAVLLILCAGAGLAAVVIMKAIRHKTGAGRIFIFVISSVLVVSFISSWYNNNVLKITAVNVGDGIAVRAQVNGECVLLGCGGDGYHRYGLDDALNGNNRRDIAFLLLPGTDNHLASYYSDLIWDYDIGKLVLPSDHTGEALAGEVIRSRDGAAVLDNRTTLSFVCRDDANAAYISRDDFSCLVLFEPACGNLPAEWLNADLLITRSRMPDADLSGFGIVFVSDSVYKSVTTPEGNVHTTSAEGDLEIIVR